MSTPSPGRTGASVQGYLGALLIFGLMLALRLTLFPPGAPFAFASFYPAVIAALYFCGLGPGLMVVALGGAAGVYLLLHDAAMGLEGLGLFLLLAFLATSLMLSWVVQRLRQTSRRLALARAAAEDSRRALMAVVDDQTDLLLRYDHEGRLSFANAIARQTFGLTDKDMQHRTWQLMFLPADRKTVAARLAALSPRSPIVSHEACFLDCTGGQRWGDFVHRALFDEDGRIASLQTTVRDVTEARGLRAQLHDMRERLQDLYDHAPCAYFSLDASGTFIQLNVVLADWLGRPMEELLGRRGLREFLAPDSQRLADQHFPLLISSGRCGPVELDLLTATGTRRVIVSATAATDEAGAFHHSRTVMYDISELAHARQRLAQVAQEQERMLDNDLIGILRLREGIIVWCNRASERMFGYAAPELLGRSARLLFASDADYEDFGREASELLDKGEKYRTQLQLVRRDGSRLWVDVNGLLLSEQGHETLWMSLDVSAMKERQQQIEHVAFHDALTGLPNRLLMMDRLRQLVLLSRRSQEPLAVAFVDLDGFKSVNDRHGHAAGDELLKIIATRLQQGMRAHDTVARVGGDEFVLLLPKLSGRAEAEQAIERLLAGLQRPAQLACGATVQVGVSVGLAMCPDNGTDVDQLLGQADQSMYRDKASHKSSPSAEATDGLEPAAMI